MFECDVDVLSSDHKPNRPDELSRITKLGGKVMHWGIWRLQGVLAVSRAIGDVSLQPYVTCEPEITKRIISDDEDMFIVLATDGVWDVLSNEDAAKCVMEAALTKPWNEVAKELCLHAKMLGSQDNISATVIDLSGVFCAPKIYSSKSLSLSRAIGTGTGTETGAMSSYAASAY
jgi:protein phosphatase 1L